jgi:glycosyltransferase 2 family protein
MKKNLKFLRWLPGVIVSAVVVIFISRAVDFNEVAHAIKNIGTINILIIALITSASLAARAIAWMKLLPKMKFLDAFLLLNEAYLFNNLIPRSGELVKTVLFAQPAQESSFRIISSVIVERSLDLVIAASMFFATFPFIPLTPELDSIRPIAFFLLIMFILFLVAAFLMAANAEKVIKLLGKIGKNNTIFLEKILPKIEMVIDGFQVLTNSRQIISIIFWISMSWLLWVLLLFIGLRSIHGGTKFWWAIFTEGVLALGIALPSAPAGLGVFEGTMVFALSLFDISKDTSFGLAVVIHALQIAMTSLIGFIAILRQGESISAVLQRIKSIQKKEDKTQQD